MTHYTSSGRRLEQKPPETSRLFPVPPPNAGRSAARRQAMPARYPMTRCRADALPERTEERRVGCS